MTPDNSAVKGSTYRLVAKQCSYLFANEIASGKAAIFDGLPDPALSAPRIGLRGMDLYDSDDFSYPFDEDDYWDLHYDIGYDDDESSDDPYDFSGFLG